MVPFNKSNNNSNSNQSRWFVGSCLENSRGNVTGPARCKDPLCKISQLCKLCSISTASSCCISRFSLLSSSLVLKINMQIVDFFKLIPASECCSKLDGASPINNPSKIQDISPHTPANKPRKENKTTPTTSYLLSANSALHPILPDSAPTASLAVPIQTTFRRCLCLTIRPAPVH